MKTIEEVSREYKESLIELERLESIFDANPCRKTAKPLAAYRNVVESKRMAVSYHPEIRRKEAREFADRMNDLVNDLAMTLRIEKDHRIMESLFNSF